MTETHDGGPAFGEIDFISRRRGATEGMSLRDWFAGQCAAAALVNATGISEAVAKDAFPVVARLAYAMADAMLAERAKGAA